MKKTVLTQLLVYSLILSLNACSNAMFVTTTAGGALNQQGRTFSDTVSDQVITYRAIKVISNTPSLQKTSRIVIVTFNHNVLLVGQTPNETLKKEAETLIRKVPNVKNIYNDITIQPPLNTYEQGNDGAITANIKSRMFSTTNLRGRNIKVITENSVVYMMGAVSKSEGNVAAEVARNSAGVKKVVKLFEYTSKN
ncbi:MAG: Periplasmic or secreted lipoprotein [uncultured bacterium]|nr:MAG: Periplasmic or secreted lipoprotein [uncultured bacterium]OGT16178.1 MAG: hypothetical protein A3B69_00745 [Gammaproteobacteria bacterium RIFCSPHIGHO2_02_FULL_38_33]OGT23489.1 MAG: hypothetical protein A2W47_05725 [Gammaproteobacteria bacterium RIFCSPHIGHO2_12_38_15]OGT69595.1 MAG: hypothetical protein A3I12_03080 [Gammaproteobacteria bacterium RIFCSPLOWO2_02_FULL_38_11]OGT75442.1 MAG: hypothetical protein A3G71_06330 [Gammaproteobacteria bacterium RIFCSPLOWO2_12_FULL_38_14]